MDINIKSITLKGFKNFLEERTFYFDSINLITGDNGKGKSALIKDSILFCFYGYSNVSLNKLPTRNRADECYVKINMDNLIVSRKYPTELKIWKNGVLLEFANSKIAQKWLNDKFKDVNYFKKFRMIDLQEGINILEEGKVSLRKTLFSFNEELFNKIRTGLMNKKRNREVYNKDNLQLDCIHYPSKKRLYQIEIGLLNLTEQLYNLKEEFKNLEENYYTLISKKSAYEENKKIFKGQENDIVQYSDCPVCKRKIGKNVKLKLLGEIGNNIMLLNSSINEEKWNISEVKDNMNHFKDLIDKNIKRKSKLSTLQYKLENRLKLIEYKYTNKDIEIIKKAIKELDGFTSYFITEWIKILEPIINDIICKVGFNIKFCLDEKDDMDIKLIKNKEEYSYKDLSSGQKLIISIGFQVALLMEKGESGVIIADEGFSSLDIKNLHIIFELFKNLPYQLLSVVHNLSDIPSGINVISL